MARGSIKIIAGVLLGALLVLFLYMGGRWLETKDALPEPRGDFRQRYAYEDVVQQDEVSYIPRKGITTILFMGIDRDNDAVVQGSRNGGQSDFLRLVVIDSVQKRVTQVQIDRDTMTPIAILSVLGQRSGVRTAQISLSHGFGDGREQSCELTVEAVSNLLLGAKIDFYVAMNLDGISVLNDQVGGVTVTLADDFSALDPQMTQGTTLTLHGEQAETFVRTRMSLNIGTNAARMLRQEQYMAELTRKIEETGRKNKYEFYGTLYDVLDDYLVTNLSRGRLMNEAWAASTYERAPLVTIQGEHRVSKTGFMQFFVDEADLQQKVLALLYQEVT